MLKSEKIILAPQHLALIPGKQDLFQQKKPTSKSDTRVLIAQNYL